MKQLITLATGIIVGIAFVYMSLAGPYFASASAPSGLPATIATTSLSTVGTTQKVVFASSSCAARIITTASSSVMLTFTDTGVFFPGALVGHLQAASTTQVYDSGLYGCDSLRIYSFTTQQITVSESR